MTLGHPTILVLEDEPLIALDIEAALTEAGYHVVVARSCAQGEEILATLRPHAAILDVRLKDGTCRAVAERLAEKSIRFILYTGFPDVNRDVIFKGRTSISKPAHPDDLVAAVKDLVAQTSTD